MDVHIRPHPCVSPVEATERTSIGCKFCIGDVLHEGGLLGDRLAIACRVDLIVGLAIVTAKPKRGGGYGEDDEPEP